MIVTALWVILVAWYFGLRERARLGRLAAERIGAPPPGDDPEIRGAVDPGKRKYFWVNLAITVALMAALLTALLPLAVLFMLAYVVAATKIGRASRRESVCQYGYISVVAVQLKKKKHTKHINS